MKIFLIDNDLDSLLSALFMSFTEKIVPDQVENKKIYQPRLDAIAMDIKTDKSKAERVKKALLSYGGDDVLFHIKICLSSSAVDALSVAFFYSRYMLSERRDVSDDLSVKYVSDFSYTVQKVLHERHVMTGLLRFSETSNGVMYSAYSPDNDITYLLAPHFLRRLGKIPFVIHDISRNKIAVSNGNAIKLLYTNLPPNFSPSNNEQLTRSLWKKYFNKINIEERKNLAQQNRYMPRRYRKYCFETYEY